MSDAPTTHGTDLVFEGRWDIPYRYSAGDMTQRFFSRLREKQVVSGSPCVECDAVYVPPRPYCERCFAELDALIDLGSSGTVEAFTVVNARFAGMPEPPYTVAYVLLDEASTSVVNYIYGLRYSDTFELLDEVGIGTRVGVVFTDAPEGKMTDFHFELSSQSE
jgi:uncharacterized OB-fold protein